MTKEEQLQELTERMKNNHNLPFHVGATNMVFGEGNIDSPIVFIGEAPGFHEDRLGRPFVGNAGDLLNKLLAKASLKREEVYITNLVKYRPPQNRDPEPKEIEAYVPYLINQIEILNPRFIATLGRFSMNLFIPKALISHVHGQPHMVNGRIVIPMYHPAAALRRGEVMAQLSGDFEKLAQILKSPEDFLSDKISEDNSQMSLFKP